ncbi:MAG: sulfite exporter TauE/SafE family protein [Chloroflexota bacterium]|nr:sulfite exporter TauE/SafE family protein [Chloroflexota bacterium]
MSAPEIVALLAIGLTAGLLAGLLGIGGGLIMVPAMVLITAFDQHVAQGTSLLVIIPAAAFGSFTHYRRGRLALRDAGALAAGGVLGAVLGSMTALALDEEILQRLFAILILVVAARMLLTRNSPPEQPDPETA